MGVRVLISGLHTVLPAKFQRIHSQLQRQVVSHAFRSKGCLGDSVAAHGAAGGDVGVHRVGVGFQRFFIVINLFKFI